MIYHILITREDRQVIRAELRRVGVPVPLWADNDKLGSIVAKHLGKPVPNGMLERTSMLKGFLDKAKAARVRRIAPARGVPKFRPLRISKEMRDAMARAKELYP